MTDDEGLECIAIDAATRQHLREQQRPEDELPPAFEAIVTRRDGHQLRVHIASLVMLATYVRDLHPRTFTLRIGRRDNGEFLLGEIESLMNDGVEATTLH